MIIRMSAPLQTRSPGLAATATSGESPDWSPSGGRLVVVRPSPNLTFAIPMGRMFVVGAHGRHGHVFLPGTRDASHPVWSPDGRWIAFERSEAGIFAKRLGGPPARHVFMSQQGSEGAFVSGFHPSWRPRL